MALNDKATEAQPLSGASEHAIQNDGRHASPALDEVERDVRHVTSNDIDDPTYSQLDSLARLSHDANACAIITSVLASRLSVHAHSWRRVLKSLMLIDYLSHTGSATIILCLRQNMAMLAPFLDYMPVEERNRDRAPAVRERARRLYKLLANEDILDAARRGVAMVLGVVASGKLQHDDELRGTASEQVQRASRDEAVLSGSAKDGEYYRSFIDVPDLTHQLADTSKRVSSGGFADVYKATWNGGQGPMTVAIKVIRETGIEGKHMLQARHFREISVWHEVRHENILPLCGLHWEMSHLPAMVSPWCENGDINKYLRSRQSDENIDEIRLKLLGDVVHGLQYLHAYNPVIVHGDIKGANVLISDDGVARLSDFGLSSVLAEHSKSFTLQTKTKGTVRWMAPELFAEDTTRHTTESDIWAFGCLVLEVQSGRVPYHNLDNDGAVLRALDRRRLFARPHGTPDRLWWLILECCDFEPEHRLQCGQVLLRVQELQALYVLHREIWHETLPLADVGLMPRTLARRLAVLMADKTVFEGNISADIYTDNVWLQAAYALIATKDGMDMSLSVGLAVPLVCAAIQICVARAATEVEDTGGLLAHVGHAVVQFMREEREGYYGFPNDAIEALQRPAPEVRAFAKFLSLSGSSHGEWVMSTLASRLVMPPFSGHSAGVSCLAFTPDCSSVVSGSFDSTLRIWDIATGSPLAGSAAVGAPLLRHDDQIVAVAVSANGRYVASCAKDDSVQIWDRETGRPASSGRITYSSVMHVVSIAIYADSSHPIRVIAGLNDGTLCIWDDATVPTAGQPNSTGRLVGPVRLDDGATETSAATSVAFSPDGAWFFCLTTRGALWKCDAAPSGGQLGGAMRIPGMDGFSRFAFSPALDRLVAGCNSDSGAESALAIWDTATGAVVLRLLDAPRCLWGVAFVKGGEEVVAAHEPWDADPNNATVTCWDARSGATSFEFAVGAISAMCVSEDGRRVATGADDGSIRVWDTTQEWTRIDPSSSS